MKGLWRRFRQRFLTVQKTEALDQRLREVEEGHKTIVERERWEIEQRLRMLELEAEVIARRHLPHNQE